MCKATVQSHKFWRHSYELDFFYYCFYFFFLFYFINFLFIYLCIYFLLSLLCLFVLLVFVLWLLTLFLFFIGLFVCACVRAFKFIFFFPSFIILRAVFTSLRVGLGLIFCWSEIKIFYFGVVYKFLSVGMELAVIKELFIILYI